MKTRIIKTAFFILIAFTLSGFKANAQKSLKIRILQDKAFNAYLKQDYEKAVTCLLQLDSIAPDSHAVYDYWIGMCLLSTENKLAAIPYLEKAKQTGKTSFVINYYLGRAYLFAGRTEDARAHFNAYSKEFSIRGVRFKKEVPLSVAHSIHTQKSLEDVNFFLAQCNGKTEDSSFSAAK